MPESDDKVVRVMQVSSVKHEADGKKYFNTGTIILYSSGKGKLRLNHIPGQEYELFDKPKRGQR